MRFRYGLLLVTTAAAVSLSACGGGEDGGSKVASVDKPSGQPSSGQQAGDDDFSFDEQVAFAKCMRDNGVDMPDPKPEDGGMIAGRAIEEGSAEMEKMNKANDACKHLLPNGGEFKPPTPEELDKMRQQAKCFRDHGLDAKDPDPNNPVMELPTLNMDDPNTKKAMEACGMGGASGTISVPGR